MIFDKQNLFSDKQTVAINDLSEQTVDFFKGDIVTTPYISDEARDLGRGTPIPIRCQLVEDAAGAVVVTILVGDAVDGSNDITTPSTLGTITIQGTTAGSWGEGQFLPHGTYGRYMQLKYSAAAVVTSGIVHGQDQAAHA